MELLVRHLSTDMQVQMVIHGHLQRQQISTTVTIIFCYFTFVSTGFFVGAFSRTGQKHLGAIDQILWADALSINNIKPSNRLSPKQLTSLQGS